MRPSSKHAKDRAPARRRSDRPIRLRVQDDRAAPSHRKSFQSVLRCGYGSNCELCLDGETGPEVLFELHRARGPIRLSTSLTPEQLEDHVDLTVDGRAVQGGVRELHRGSRIEVVDKATRRRYRMVVDPPPFWFVRPWFLAIVMLVLALLGAGYGGYVYRVLSGTKTLLTNAQERLARAERGVERAKHQAAEAVGRVASAETALAGGVDALKRAQADSQAEIRAEFGQRLGAIGKRARDELSRLSEHDTRAREALEAKTRASIDAVRGELAARMVEAYQRSKDLEQRLLQSVASRVEAIEPGGERFKRILKSAQEAVLFVHTHYELEFVQSGEMASYDSFGTGFLIDANGRGLTAQHVLFPWRFEREFLVLEQLGFARLRPESVRRSVWRLGEEVMTPGSNPPELRTDTGYHSDSRDRPVRFLHAPDLDTAEELVAAPTGVVKIRVPLADRKDVAAFQIMDFDRRFGHLSVDTSASPPEPLDEVLVVGYPLSRLRGETAVPQGVRGFVRRTGSEVTELDTPLHPGLSGAPVLDRDGRVVGMAIAIIQSVMYGMAVRGRDLARFLGEVEVAARAEEERLRRRGCDPGPVDGRFDRDTLAAYRCEWRAEDAAKAAKSAQPGTPGEPPIPTSPVPAPDPKNP